MKITSSKNNYQFSDNESAYITMSADQSTDLTSGNYVKFNTIDGNVTFAPATYIATLKKNRRYKLSCCLLCDYSGNTGTIQYRFYNVTTSAYVGVKGYGRALTSTSDIDGKTIAYYEITPTVDTQIAVLIQASTALTNIYTDYSYISIEQINIVSPVIPDPTRDYAYVSPQLDLAVTGTNYTSLFAKGIFYKTNNGIWWLRASLECSQTSATTNTLAIAGVVFSNLVSAYQNVSICTSSSLYYALYGLAQKNTGNVLVRFDTAVTGFFISLDVALASKPTGFAIPSDV